MPSSPTRVVIGALIAMAATACSRPAPVRPAADATAPAASPAAPAPPAVAAVAPAPPRAPAGRPEPAAAAAPGPAGDLDGAAAKPSRKEMLAGCLDGVVVVTVFDALDEKTAFGSGCVVGPGVILTNHHVVANAVRVEIQQRGHAKDTLAEPIRVDGFSVVDEGNDLVLLVVGKLPDTARVLPVATPESIDQFDEVFAIGHPDGLKFSTTPGFVSRLVKTGDLPEELRESLAGSDTECIQTDAVIAGGSSGGPLLNERGEIVGINTLLPTDRIALAVSARHVRDVLRQAADGPRAEPFPLPGADADTTRAVAELRGGSFASSSSFRSICGGPGPTPPPARSCSPGTIRFPRRSASAARSSISNQEAPPPRTRSASPQRS